MIRQLCSNIIASHHDDDDHTEPESPSILVRLQSKEHEEILDVIDQLRSEGIGQHVDLPELVVCGDQSSGKSSVLEAISGLNFPRKDNRCTRFATELILRRGPAATDDGSPTVTVSIIPDKSRPLAEQKRISQFRPPHLELNNFGNIVESAEAQIALGKDTTSFFGDVLQVKVTGPDQPHLTMVDLPGLYNASDELQTKEGISFVDKLVWSYIENPRSVILAVISAESDLALQKVTDTIHKFDPSGERTMGIITKPDRLDPGSEKEMSFVNLAQNKNSVISYRLGWHVLKNREYRERNYSLAEREASESKFFHKGAWSSLPRSHLGITTLRPRLSSILKDHIVSQLSGFIDETQSSLVQTQLELEKLGSARQTLTEQRRYLLQSSEKFSTLIGDSINGVYFDAFFGDALDTVGYKRRLRAVVQNRLTEFSNFMLQEGQDATIVEDGESYVGEHNWIYRSQLVEEVRQRMRRSRGRELPGTYNPLIIGDLFHIQSGRWEKIASSCITALLEDVRIAISPILADVLDDRSSQGMLDHILEPHLTLLEQRLRDKTTELLHPQRVGHPITHNPEFIAHIQVKRAQHRRSLIEAKLKTFFGSSYMEGSSTTSPKFRMEDLIEALSAQTEADLETSMCNEALDCMEAYYMVAIKKFVDDFSNLAVERCLLEPLLGMFGPRTVETMTDETVTAIAGEDENTIVERIRLTDKIDILGKCVVRLNRLNRHKMNGHSNFTPRRAAQGGAPNTNSGVGISRNGQSATPTSAGSRERPSALIGVTPSTPPPAARPAVEAFLTPSKVKSKDSKPSFNHGLATPGSDTD